MLHPKCLCARLCVRHSGYSGEQTDMVLALMELNLLEKTGINQVIKLH